MSFPKGRAILQAIRNFRAKNSGWPTKGVDDLAELIVTTFQRRNQITAGGVASLGTGLTAAVLPIDLTAMDCTLNGKIRAQLALLNDVDLFTTAASIGRATFQDGADASGIAVDSNGTVRGTVVATNSNGAGGVTDTDNGAVILVAVLKGTAATAEAQTTHLTSQEIQDALDAATGVHSGGVSWAHVTQFNWNNPAGTPAATFTLNRNNHLGV